MHVMKRFFTLAAIAVLGVTLLSNLDKAKSEKVAAADEYKVIKVDGTIIFQTTKKNMVIGDIFVSGTGLDFSTPDSRAAVISKLKGRYVLSSAEKGQTKILPAANNISSRAGALINIIDLQNHFTGRYLVIDKAALEIGEEAFPQNDDAFFYLAYYHNDEQIRKKLSHEENSVILDKDEIFMIDERPIEVSEKEMTLFYRNGGSSSKISTFTPVFPDTDELKLEVEIILEEFSDKDNPTKIKEITAYLNEFYGKPQEDNLNGWLETEFQITE